jgi:hypothetical protein
LLIQQPNPDEFPEKGRGVGKAKRRLSQTSDEMPVFMLLLFWKILLISLFSNAPKIKG